MLTPPPPPSLSLPSSLNSTQKLSCDVCLQTSSTNAPTCSEDHEQERLWYTVTLGGAGDFKDFEAADRTPPTTAIPSGEKKDDLAKVAMFEVLQHCRCANISKAGGIVGALESLNIFKQHLDHLTTSFGEDKMSHFGVFGALCEIFGVPMGEKAKKLKYTKTHHASELYKRIKEYHAAVQVRTSLASPALVPHLTPPRPFPLPPLSPTSPSSFSHLSLIRTLRLGRIC